MKANLPDVDLLPMPTSSPPTWDDFKLKNFPRGFEPDCDPESRRPAVCISSRHRLPVVIKHAGKTHLDSTIITGDRHHSVPVPIWGLER